MTAIARASRVPRVGVLRSVGDLAKEMGRSYRATMKLFARMHAKDVVEGMAPSESWWIDAGKYSSKFVNIQRLRARHPALFERRYVSREEHDDVVASNSDLRRQVHKLGQKVNSLAARITKLERREGESK